MKQTQNTTTFIPTHQEERTRIRRDIRTRRQSLTSLEQTLACEDALFNLQQLPVVQSARKIAIYLSVDGELDTHPMIEYFWQQGITVCLPVLHPFSPGHLLFLEYAPDSAMTENKFNIQEPKLDVTKVIPVAELDIIFTPLVAFDSEGHRLGMGGGYYDRTLENWFRSRTGPRPVGIAHDCQFVQHLPTEHWDVPLPVVVTPGKIWHW
ncbi:5-formyltetrahydrofolate cyclo-ligase [Vibrio sp. HA2012]|uniref:5-formyltetrahydrofolate cyclo-ligase n=1 Tax=Vibrio sp. HA2012 TaxID=1971595 RepID=UPI000C2CCE98|nr:5-formyltetrahydrofolate cyclo-ligase [Vibrio sp. HA2012]PJC86269.1 5-formyltetrahydrofolate cyclo-ligase [Vibrio sp. HA2012]